MKRFKLLTVAGLVAILSAGTVLPVLATDVETAEQEAAATQEELDSLRTSIDDLEVQKEELTGEIDELEARLWISRSRNCRHRCT